MLSSWAKDVINEFGLVESVPELVDTALCHLQMPGNIIMVLVQPRLKTTNDTDALFRNKAFFSLSHNSALMQSDLTAKHTVDASMQYTGCNLNSCRMTLFKFE